MKTINILYVEDHEMVRKSIKSSLLNQKSFVAHIDEASDGLEAIYKVTDKKYDVIILDINLPIKDGINVAQTLKSKEKDVRILALTLHNDFSIIKQMLDAGALGYVLKTASIEELTKAILKVYNYDKYYCNDIAQIIIHNTKKIASKSNNYIENQLSNIVNNITQRELEILKYISLEYTNKEIGEKLNISQRTVGNHRNNLINKLHVKNSIGIATYAVKNGLI